MYRKSSLVAVGIAIFASAAAVSAGSAISRSPTVVINDTCRGTTWPRIPMDCLNGGTGKRYVRFIRADFEGHQGLSGKSDRLPSKNEAAVQYETFETRGNQSSTLTLVRTTDPDKHENQADLCRSSNISVALQAQYSMLICRLLFYDSWILTIDFGLNYRDKV